MYNILRCLFGRWSLVRRVGKGRFSYAGPYHGGYARYVYLETPSGRVYDGPFSFSGGSMTARTLFFNSPYDDGIIKFGGRYARGRKTGRWKYQRRGRGYSRRLTVDYVDGIPEGTACYIGRGNTYGIGPRSRTVMLTLSMAGGMPVGPISGRFGDIPFSGQCDADGYPDGMWVYGSTSRKRTSVDYEHWEHGKLLESYSLDFSTGHRREKAPSMLALVKDIICEECIPLVNSVRRNAAVWDGDIKVKEA